MLSTIFLFETKRWFKNWSFYLFILIFGGLGFLTMAASVGYFDGLTVTTSSVTYMNSPLAINGILGGISMFVNFIIPTVIGVTIYRDFKYNTHAVLYSYPFTKTDYLLGKFLSGVVITTLVCASVAFGMILATILPFANQELLAPFSLWSYLQAFIYFVIPNIFIIGSFTFLLTTLLRNEYVGYIFVIVLMIFISILSVATTNVDDKYIYTLYDYSGQFALSHLTEYWTINEQNNNNIPFEGALLHNRLIWIGIGVVVFLITALVFKFDYNAFTIRRNKKGTRLVKNNFNTDLKVQLPAVSFNFSFISQLKTAFSIARIEFKSILKNWLFLIFFIIMIISLLVEGYFFGEELYGTKKLPVTGEMLNIARSVTGYISILIMLFSGVLLNQARTYRMNVLVDSTPVRNWTLLLSKVIALVKMVITLLLVTVIICMLIQVYYGYYEFQLAIYLRFIFQFVLVGMLISIISNLFIQSFFNKFYVGFFVILLVGLIPFGLSKLGIELDIYHFDSGPSSPRYSEFNGFGNVRTFYYYKLYWLLFCGILYGLMLLLWKRGIITAKERIQNFSKRLHTPIVVPMLICVIAFVFLGYKIFERYKITEPFYTSKEMEKMRVDYEKTYKKYQSYPHPRITDVNVHLDIYPETQDFRAIAKYIMINKTDQSIDSLFLSHDKKLESIQFDVSNQLVIEDTLMDVKIFKLNRSLQPGDSLKVEIITRNQSNTWLDNRSPILANGTFVNNMQLFPSFGYSPNMEIVDNDVRKKYNLPDRERMLDPHDEEGRKNTYISNEADWINFEATVGTSENQIAIAPGYLQKEWVENGRRYFHYKMDSKILNFYAFNSATYEVKRKELNGINLEVYYLAKHHYNVDRMLESMEKSITYYSENFSPYQHRQARIIEFPATLGTFAQAFANTMPFSEAIGFIADVDEENPNAVDYPFSVVSHEMAHQWWAHQVIGADVKGATMLSESLSEYGSLKVLEQKYGRGQMHKFLKDALDSYLKGRTFEWKEENPLMYNENQQYIHYNKGSLVMYAMSEFLGEKNFNNILASFIKQKAFQSAPYTTSVEFVNHLKAYTPEAYQYLIHDMFETITLYDNKVIKTDVKELSNGKYQVDMYFQVAKYKTDTKGEEIYTDAQNQTLTKTINGKEVKSLPLNDYVFVGIYGPKVKKEKYEYENEWQYVKVKVNNVYNKYSFIVDEKPYQVGVDPYNILIDRDSNDNRQIVK